MKNLMRYVLTLLVVAGSFEADAQVPVMSSLPSSTNVIFLDFDGQTVNGTSWNTTGPIYCGAATLDATQITEIFNRVSEDYRPFNINITTDSTKYFAAPANRRTRVILTVTSSWYGSAGGVAYTNSFTWGDNTPCFVFTALLNNNVKNISEAASHEAGHTLGLRHQSVYDSNCVKTAEYNGGIGTGEIGWAPIMGVGYYENLTLWHSGPNSLGCNSIQNDLSVITSAYNGVTFRADDYGSTFASADNVTFTTGQFSINGIVEQNTDQDFFKFTLAGNEHFTLDAVPYNVGTGSAGSDLDMQVSIYNSSQVLLGTYNPGMLLSSIIDTSLSAGTYYLKVEGKGNIYAPNYASLGSYALHAQVIGVVLPVHKLELKGTFNQNNHVLNWTVVADEEINDQVLEASTDGRNFAPIARLSKDDRSYTYRPATTGAIVYRVGVRFDNNAYRYSNMVTIRQPSDNSRPKLVSTYITNNTITVTSPGKFDYTLLDINGKLLQKGLLTAGMNTIAAGAMHSGIYIVRFTDGTTQWAEKLVKK